MPSCNHPTDFGPCAYEADACLFHRPAADVPDDQTTADPIDPRATLQLVLDAVKKGDASPLQVQRLVRAIEALNEMSAELTDEERRDEAYLRGKVMNGIPPETIEEWELARLIYDDEALEDLARWTMLAPDAKCPDWVNGLCDPEDPRFAWRFKHADGPWNNASTRRRMVSDHARRGLDDDPYEGAEPSNDDGYHHREGSFREDVAAFRAYEADRRPSPAPAVGYGLAR